jgi:hypothetical protein
VSLRLLRIALRRSWGLYGVPPLLAVELINAFAREQAFAYSWAWAANWTGTSLALVGPILLAVGAAESVVAHRSNADDLVRSTVRGAGAQLALRSLTLGLYASACHLVGVLIIVTVTISHAGWLHPPILPIVVPFIACFTFAALGESLGALLPYLAAPVLLGLGGFAVRTYLVLHGGGATLIETGDATGDLLGLRERSDVLLLQASWFVLVIAIAIAILPMVWARGRTNKLLAGGVVLAAVGVAFPLTQVHNTVTHVSSLTWVCQNDAPQVCVVDGYDDFLPQATELVSESVAVLSQINDNIPDRWEQLTAVDTEPSTGYFGLEARNELASSGVALDVVAWSVDCPPARGIKRARAQYQRYELVAAWMGKSLGFGVYLGPGTEEPTEENARQALKELHACP